MDANSLPTVTSALSIDVTTLYYTYSTIAQTLAGAFGIIGAFVLFRLQNLNQVIRASATGVHDNLDSRILNRTVKTSLQEEKWEAFLKAIEDDSLSKKWLGETVLWEGVIDKVRFKNHRESLKRSLETKGNVVFQLKLIARWTALTIILSLVLLPLSSILASYATVSIFLLGIATVMTIKCIRHYMSLISSALTEYPEVN